MMGLAHCRGLSIRFPLSLITNLCKHLCATFCVDMVSSRRIRGQPLGRAVRPGLALHGTAELSSGHSSPLELLLLLLICDRQILGCQPF